MSRAARTFAVLSAAAILALAGSPGVARADGGRPQSNPEQRAAALIRPAVMVLSAQTYGMVKLPDGRTLSLFGEGSSAPIIATWTCTAFVVNPDGWVATAGHCADPDTARRLILTRAATEYLRQFPDSPVGDDPLVVAEWLSRGAKVEGAGPGQSPSVGLTLVYGTGTKVTDKVPASVVDFRRLGEGDVALLKIDRRNLPSSELATDAEVSIGTPMLAVGFPETTQRATGRTLDPTNKSGKVSKKSSMESSPVYEIDAALAEGMSGGPAVDLSGRVIGVNSFGPVGEPQAFNFVAPADGLASLMAAKAVRSALGPADRHYRQGLAHYYAGRYTDAIKDFDQALMLSPDYPGLVDLKASAANLRQQYGDVATLRDSKLLWYGGGAVVVLLVVGAWVVTAKMRGRRRAEAVPGEPVVARPLELVPVQRLSPGEPHFCANCGAQHHHSEKFCPNCGEKIVQGESA
ncbi:trypsin-like peptidase domain-containing protein [Mycobacterium vicinigordonae]|uniref:Trypsin-like peptidase domain-containing protein n=2 Tax=Mycobacterium vicinigordonae TaxID=1719132 RepID=A0A7D6I4T6_9MYCO|nr:trypsin-like peptidase domain-containing protein [Mycobacterium vicinigordonae]